MRELRRKDRTLDKLTAEKLLHEEWVGHLGTCGRDGPYVVPLCFVYAPDGVIFIHCASDGQKIENMALNARVCFEVEKIYGLKEASVACSYGLRYRSVIAFGYARRVNELIEKTKAVDLLMRKYAGEVFPSIDKDRLAATTVIAIDIDRLSGKGNLPTEGES